MFNPDGRLINDVGNFQSLSDAVLYNAIAHSLEGTVSSNYSKTAGASNLPIYASTTRLARLGTQFPLSLPFFLLFNALYIANLHQRSRDPPYLHSNFCQGMVPRQRDENEPQFELCSNATGPHRTNRKPHWYSVRTQLRLPTTKS
jgi:hypothetical protein